MKRGKAYLPVVGTKNYLVILSDRGSFMLPWTAYLVERPHQKRKLQKEYEEYFRNKGQKC